MMTQIPEIGGGVGFFFGASLIADLSLNTLDHANFTLAPERKRRLTVSLEAWHKLRIMEQIPDGATATFIAAGDGNSSATGWQVGDSQREMTSMINHLRGGFFIPVDPVPME